MSILSLETCSISGFGYTKDSQDVVVDGIDSLSQCQGKCKSSPSCKVWSYNEGARTCYMKNNVQSTQPIVANPDFTLGQKYCPSKWSLIFPSQIYF